MLDSESVVATAIIFFAIVYALNMWYSLFPSQNELTLEQWLLHKVHIIMMVYYRGGGLVQ